MGYEINSNNYILFDKDNIFRGLLFTNISEDEVKEMRQSFKLIN